MSAGTIWLQVRALLLIGVALQAATGWAADSRGPHPVGLSSVKYVDPTRQDWNDSGPRPLATAVWYPAPDGTREADWTVEIFNAGHNAMGAPIAALPAKLPLIVVSHGTGGSAAGMAWLAETLAANGYLVAAVNHHGNTGFEDSTRLEGFIVWWDRPRDVSVLIDRLLADPRFGPRIDASRIGVAGFSIGGYRARSRRGATFGVSASGVLRSESGEPPVRAATGSPIQRRGSAETARHECAGEDGNHARGGSSGRSPRQGRLRDRPCLGSGHDG